MAPRSWIRRLFTRTRRRAPQRSRQPRPRFRPGLDRLEARLTPSRLGTTALLEGPAAGSASDLVITSGAWSATSNAPWLRTSSNGSGSGLAMFTFDANPGATRSGTLTIAGLTLTVTQAGSTYVPASPVTLVTGLNYPAGVAVDGAGNVFIADYGNGVVQEWHAATGTVSTLVTGLSGPQGVAVDGAGNVFIANTGKDAVEERNATTGTVSTLVTGLNGPVGVAVDGAGNVFIANADQAGPRTGAVKEWNAATRTVSTLVSGVSHPGGVAVDAAGNVYFSDTFGRVVEEWHAATGTVSTLVTGLNFPSGVAVDGAGNVFIADYSNGVVQEWHAATGTVSTLVTGLNFPSGVAVDGAGSVFIADFGNGAVKELAGAFVPGGVLSEGAAAGSDALLPVLPTTQPLTGVFAPSSDQSWLIIDGAADGVVHFSFTQNTGPSRMAHLTVLGQQIAVTQAGATLATHFQVTPSADSVTAGTPVSLTVTAKDDTGKPAPYLGTVHFSSTDPQAGLPPDYTFTAADNGVHTFEGVLLRTAGSQSVTATDTATRTITGSATITVERATPTITWDNPAAITYGTPLGPTQLDASADIPGTFTYSPAAGTVLNAGSNQVLTVHFTPADNPDRPLSKQVAITVDPVPLTVTADATRWYGRPDSTATVTATYTGLVNGDTEATIGGPPAFTDSATLGSPPGKYRLTPFGLTTSNYRITYLDGALTVTPALMSSHLDPNIKAVTGKPVTQLLTKVDNVDPFGSAASYTATIDWGDGTTTAGKVVAENPAYYYDVYDGGGHTYAARGTYTITVTVRHKLGYTTTATATGTARVTGALLSGGRQLPPGPAPVPEGHRHRHGRPADGPGLEDWVALLQAGGTRLPVAEGVWTSPGHRGCQVDLLDATCLHRSADAAGRDSWVNALLGGQSEIDVADAFLTSDESFQAHRGLTACVTGLYADVLGRSPDAADTAMVTVT
jgi:sugar lactone lactonase YvrE